jgi:nicotinamide-nucleotide amidase
VTDSFELEQAIGELLRQKGLTLGAVESATGGLISHRITSIAGSSDYYKGSITSYSNEIKMKLVGVKAETLKKYGAVSHQVAEEMAEGGRKALNADICIADTGIAGPGGATPDKPVGLFYLGLAHKSGTFSQRHVFSGDRLQNKQSAAEAALSWLREFLLTLKTE